MTQQSTQAFILRETTRVSRNTLFYIHKISSKNIQVVVSTILVVQVSISLFIWKRRVKSGVKSGGLREKNLNLNGNCKIKRDAKK